MAHKLVFAVVRVEVKTDKIHGIVCVVPKREDAEHYVSMLVPGKTVFRYDVLETIYHDREVL